MGSTDPAARTTMAAPPARRAADAWTRRSDQPHVQLSVAGAAGASGSSAAGDPTDDRRGAGRRCRPRFAQMYSDIGRPSIPPEQLLRALLLQVLYTVRSERLLMEEIDYSVLFRWFIGLGMDDADLVADTFSKNRERLLAGRYRRRLLRRGGGPGARRRAALRRALHGRRHAAGGVGQPEELPAAR